MSSLRRSVFLLAAALAPLPACKTEEAVKTHPELFSEMCAQLFSCGCREFPYADVAQCEQVHAVDYAGIEAAAQAAGLTVDVECMIARLPVSEYQCMTASQVFDDEGAPQETCSYCSIAYGVGEAGQPCVQYGSFDDCKSGLACRAGRCVNPCLPLAEGEDCWSEDVNCAPGLHCDIDVGICVRLPVEGQPCELECAQGLYCDQESSMCVKPPGAGEPCPDFECATGLACTFSEAAGENVCSQPPGLGEPCDTVCMDPLFCAFDFDTGVGECVQPGKDGEPCDLAPCEEGLVCPIDTSVCQGPPGPGETCVDGSCADSAYCNFDTDVCDPLPGPGETCLEGFYCADGFECDLEGVCQAEQALVCEL